MQQLLHIADVAAAAAFFFLVIYIAVWVPRRRLYITGRKSILIVVVHMIRETNN